MQNPAYISRPERDEVPADQPGVAAPDAEHFRAMKERAPGHRADRGVHSRCVAAAGEERDPFHPYANKMTGNSQSTRSKCAADCNSSKGHGINNITQLNSRSDPSAKNPVLVDFSALAITALWITSTSLVRWRRLSTQ
jgi:hypothetical protein